MGLSATKVKIVKVEVTPTEQYDRRERVEITFPNGKTGFWYAPTGGWSNFRKGDEVWVSGAVRKFETKKGVMLHMVRETKPGKDPKATGLVRHPLIDHDRPAPPVTAKSLRAYVIDRKNRLAKLEDMKAPQVILDNQNRMLRNAKMRCLFFALWGMSGIEDLNRRNIY